MCNNYSKNISALSQTEYSKRMAVALKISSPQNWGKLLIRKCFHNCWLFERGQELLVENRAIKGRVNVPMKIPRRLIQSIKMRGIWSLYWITLEKTSGLEEFFLKTRKSQAIQCCLRMTSNIFYKVICTFYYI